MNDFLIWLGMPLLFSSMLSSLAGNEQCTLFDTRGC